MRLVISLGGSATAANQAENVEGAAAWLAPVIQSNETAIIHGNGPQLGLPTALMEGRINSQFHVADRSPCTSPVRGRPTVVTNSVGRRALDSAGAAYCFGSH
jgi:hypothetical protein